MQLQLRSDDIETASATFVEICNAICTLDRSKENNNLRYATLEEYYKAQHKAKQFFQRDKSDENTVTLNHSSLMDSSSMPCQEVEKLENVSQHGSNLISDHTPTRQLSNVDSSGQTGSHQSLPGDLATSCCNRR